MTFLMTNPPRKYRRFIEALITELEINCPTNPMGLEDMDCRIQGYKLAVSKLRQISESLEVEVKY